MGLESHITRELQREKSGYVQGEDYWFSFGLKADTEDVARDMAKILNGTGDFGQATVIWDASQKLWGIEFGVHKSFLKE